MRGVKILGKRSLEVCDWPDPEPRGDEVVVKIRAASICGSDLHGIYRREGGHNVIPGHEGMGEVVAVDSPRNVRTGDRVMILAIIGCARCPWCRQGAAHVVDPASCDVADALAEATGGRVCRVRSRQHG